MTTPHQRTQDHLGEGLITYQTAASFVAAAVKKTM
jgi:hypothetical protein